MTPATPNKLRISVFLKCILILTVATAIVAGVIAVTSDRAIREVASNGLRQLSIEGTETLAEGLSGALRFRKVDDVQVGLDQFASARPGQISGGLAIFADGTDVFTQGQLTSSELEQLRNLAEVAIATGGPETTFDGFWRSQPVMVSGEVIGAVAVAWSPEEDLAVIDEGRREQLLLAGGVFVLLTLASGLFLRQSLAVPLKRIAARTTDMADGDLTSAVGHTKRTDEIGQIARQLDFLRSKLEAAEISTRDAHFKSAGFQGASVPLVMTDETFKITHINQAFQSLTQTTCLQEHYPNLAANEPVGQTLDPRTIDSKRFGDAALSQLPAAADISLGKATFNIALSEIRDYQGTLTGYIMEWNDVSSAHVTRAVLSALEAAQVRADFSSEGVLVSVNKIAERAAPNLLTGQSMPHISDIVRPVNGADLNASLRAGKPHYDTFHFAKDRIVSGIVSPIMSTDSDMIGIVFLGHDITETEMTKQRAETERLRLESDQKAVVEALNQGLNALAEGNLTIRLDTPFPKDHEVLREHFNSSIETMETAVGGCLGQFKEHPPGIRQHRCCG